MNNKQKKIFLFMVSANTVMALFPPWLKLVKYNPKIFNNAGYHFILMPPSGSATINVTTLIVQFAIITMLSSSLYYFFKSPKKVSPDIDKHVANIVTSLIEGDEDSASKSFKAILSPE